MPEDFSQSEPMSEDVKPLRPLEGLVRSSSHHEAVERRSGSPGEEYVQAGCTLVELSQTIASRDFGQSPIQTLTHAGGFGQSSAKVDFLEETNEKSDGFSQLTLKVEDFGHARSSPVECDQKSGKVEDFGHPVSEVEGFGVSSNASEGFHQSEGKAEDFSQSRSNLVEFSQSEETLQDFNLSRSNLVEFNQSQVKIEDFSHSRSNLEEFNQSEAKLEDFSQPRSNVEDFNQSQGNVEDFNQSQGNVEDFNQSEGNVEDFNQSQGNVEDFNQSQGNIEDFNQSQGNVEDFSQSQGNVEDFNQSEGNVEHFNQSQGNIEDFNQSQGNVEDFSQSQGNVEDFNQSQGNVEDFSQSQGNVEDFSQSQGNVEDFGQPRSSVEAYQEYHQPSGKMAEFGRAAEGGGGLAEYEGGAEMQAALLVAVSREWQAKCGSGQVKVIPMHEELEVRLEEGSFPVGRDLAGMDWYPAPPGVGARGQSDGAANDAYTSGQALKLELEVTLTPEASSAGGPSPGSPPASVIPPTTIVCLPSLVVSAPHMVTPSAGGGRPASSSALPYLALSGATPLRALATQVPKGAPGGSGQAKNKLGREPAQGAASSGRNSRGASSKPPPGAVNLERSYQICQAVIQNSPNRDQLRAQLKPPPPLLSRPPRRAPGTPAHPGLVTTSKSVRPLPPPKPAGLSGAGRGSALYERPLRLPSPPPPPPSGGVVRHVFTSAGGIPVTMAVLPQGVGGGVALDTMALMQESLGGGGQYILVQRAAEAGMDILAGRRNSGPPRASSAPPANRNMGLGGGVRPMGGRGRPASVDVRQEYVCPPPERYLVACPSPGTQAVSRPRDIGHGMSYADVGDAAPPGRPELSAAPRSQPRLGLGGVALGGVALGGGGFGTQCGGCNARPMVVCRKCGAFCHDDCISAASICGACLVR